MRVTFFHSDKPRERMLAEAFAAGAMALGDDVELQELNGTGLVAHGADVAVMVGVKSTDLWRANMDAGIHVAMLDKGYIRAKARGPVKSWEYWRIAVDAHHPTHYLGSMRCPADRWDALGLNVQPWREQGDHVVFAGSSEKYHTFYGIEHPTRFARKLLRDLREYTDRRVIYRPKPSWRDAKAIRGADFSRDGGINELLIGAHALITHGSNACFEAMLAGVPSIVLGDAVARPISSHVIADIEAIRLATDDERRQWLANLAYCQWTLDEIASGEAWKHTRIHVHG